MARYERRSCKEMCFVDRNPVSAETEAQNSILVDALPDLLHCVPTPTVACKLLTPCCESKPTAKTSPYFIESRWI